MASPRPRSTPTLGKLRRPRLGRAITRERLFQHIDDSATVPVLWVCGPAGFGKSTLVATYLEARELPSLWLQLDAGDADPATFAHFLGEAAAVLAPRKRIRLPLPTADDLRDVTGFIRRCFRHLAQVLGAPWVLVLDNAQELDRAPALHGAIAAALDEIPERARIVVISREPPPAPYARALAGQQVVIIDAVALRFRSDETGALLQLHERNWSADALCQAADGWAAAMILMLASDTEPGPLEAARADDAPQRVFELFAGEVLEAMEPWQRQVLQRIAFLPSTTAAMAVRLGAEPRAGALLEELARRGLFTDRRGGTVVVYAFHALFSAFLRARAAAELGTDALHTLRIDAARLLADTGLADAAVVELLGAQAWPEAFAMLQAHAGAFIAQGRTALIGQALAALPESWRKLPQACYWQGFCELAVDATRALALLQQAHAGFVADGDAEGAFEAAAAAADAIIFQGANYDALAPWMPLLESQAVQYLQRRSPERDLRVLPGLLAAFVHRDPGHALTAPLADAAEQMLDQPLGASQRILVGSLAYYLLWTGQTPRLDRILVKIDLLGATQDAAPATLLRWCGVGVLVRSLLGRIDEALEQATRALALAQGSAPQVRVKAHLLMVLAAESARDAELARSHLAEAATLLAAGSPVDVTSYEFQRGMLMLLDEDWRSAAQLMRAAVVSGRDSGWPLREHIALIGQALAATQVDSFDEAETALQAALDHPFYWVCRWHHWILALVEARLADRRGQGPRALDALRRAFATGRACGFDFGPMPYCCGDMMPRLAALALTHNIDPPFVQQMVRRYALPAPADAPANWPWPVRIRTLGGFAFERDGGPTGLSRKESRKPLDLLKLLIALGGQNVPVTRLCANLWPDAAGDAARNSFDNTLHRLRKLLGAERHLALRAGSLSLDASTCWTDVTALEARLAAPHAALSDVAAPADWIDAVLALYQGSFLAGDDDLPDVLVARERIESRITRQVVAQGARLENAGHHAAAARLYQRLVEHQPLAEDLARRLMGCLLELGQRAEALAVYRRCRQQLSVVLGVRPAAETEALAGELRNL
ncbi:MAG: BTAD domain-containing putative transcriptional regulator [Betaproteobacteria bacterium]